MEVFDCIVIGTGQAGPSLAGKLCGEGKKTAIIERRLVGGTCVNYGCIPTKTLVATARAAHVVRSCTRLGIEGSEPKVNFARVMERKDEVLMASRDGLTGWLEGMENCTFIRGHGTFTDAHTVQVETDGGGSRTLTAPQIFINVGGRSMTPPSLPGLDTVDWLDNVGILSLTELPTHLIVFGGSYIALEFAQIFRRLGVEVTVVQRGARVLSREDPDISQAVYDVLVGEGVNIVAGTSDWSVAKGDGGVGVRFKLKHGAEEKVIDGSHLLVAIGRIPNTDSLGLDKAGIAIDRRGYIKVDDELRCEGVEGVWAMGDCNGKGGFTHTSYNDFQIIAANLDDDAGKGEGRKKVSDRITAYNVYTDPPLARIGLSETQVRATGRPALIATRPFTRVGRAFEKGETAGFMKVMVDPESELILGACFFGIESDEVIHCLLDIMYAKTSYKVIRDAVHIHPTVSELVPTLLESLAPMEASGGAGGD